MRKMSNGLCILSITEKIDDIFNFICKKINDVIGSYIGLKFFLRRTLGGCEFGICFDIDIENIEINRLENENCFIDKDPLLMFTISVKSLAPILAGILIIGLVYIASISVSIAEWISTFPIKLTKKKIVKIVKEIATVLLKSQIEKVCEGIGSYLIKVLVKQIKKMKEYKPKMANLFDILLKIAGSKDFSQFGDKINNLFAGKTKLKMKSKFLKNFIHEKLPVNLFLKIDLLIMLCFALFMMNFHYHHKSLKYSTSKVAVNYNKKQDTEKSLDQNKKFVNLEKLDPIDLE